MKDNIFLIIGRSGSGKSTIVDELCKRYGYTSVESYTTRPPRGPSEGGHIFVTKDTFDELKPFLCAYTKYNNFEYGVTNEQIELADLYVIDPAGVEYFAEHYAGHKTPIVIYIYADKATLIERMKKRGNSDEEIASRLLQDECSFATETIENLPVPYSVFLNYDLDEAVNRIHAFMELHEKDE